MSTHPIANLSIICANYNNGRYLDDFIRSVVDSTMHPAELIVIDDGSTDNSMEVLESYRHLLFLRIIAFPQNRGFTAALNAGLEAATAKYIMRADPDDLMMPERIETQFAYLESHPEVDMLGSNFINFDDQTGIHIITSNFPLSSLAIKNTYRKGEHGLAHATVCGKSRVFKKYRYQKIFPGEDYELFARMVKDGCLLLNLPEPLYLVRVHRSSSTSNISLSGIRQTFEFRDRIFGTRSSRLMVWSYYQHIKHYRRFQLAKNIFIRIFHLALASLLYPQKALARLS